MMMNFTVCWVSEKHILYKNSVLVNRLHPVSSSTTEIYYWIASRTVECAQIFFKFSINKYSLILLLYELIKVLTEDSFGSKMFILFAGTLTPYVCGAWCYRLFFVMVKKNLSTRKWQWWGNKEIMFADDTYSRLFSHCCINVSWSMGRRNVHKWEICVTDSKLLISFICQ